ncbi:hypothetical protein OBBRIDRAFT_890943 [Obba rivulosa]|uniref:Uncharacterized protein n=1 Tax=Obba rivulosa TaxID=1052685 RepID=A0A8E2AKC5_9APHY|nr:hypothetical protein OBBRIDRAFT_890943 [Obba rivulosa]
MAPTSTKVWPAEQGGKMVPLLQADRLADCIIGCAVENTDIEMLLCDFSDDIKTAKSAQVSSDAVAKKVQARLATTNIKINTLNVENLYVDTDRSRKNRETWRKVKSLREGKIATHLVEHDRIQSRFRQAAATQKIERTQEIPDLAVVNRLLLHSLARA